jgi:hypothetical protein
MKKGKRMCRVTRRSFAKTLTASAVTVFAGREVFGETSEMTQPSQSTENVEEMRDAWRSAREDPVRARLLASGPPKMDEVLTLFPRLKGAAPFDAAVIKGNIERLKTVPEVDTGHPLLDRAVKTGLAYIDATFQGNHPKYGVKAYGQNRHDSFPPTIIAAVDALSAWGFGVRAAEVFRYWLTTFVQDDGTIAYYGPSISEYGQLLHTAALLEERVGPSGWWEDGYAPLSRLAEHLLALRAGAEGEGGLIAGSPEADEREKVAHYFQNNGWAAKGLRRWADLCERREAQPPTPIETVRRMSQALVQDTLAAIERTWPADPADYWLPPMTEPIERPEYVTATRDGSYTNYRYWPELLSSGVLPQALGERMVNARLTGGGQFCGITRFADRLDDWPLADYLYGLWSLGRKNDFLLSLYGHVAYHQDQDHLTAYEQVTFPPGEETSPYCLPCQLVAVRAARLLVA